MRSADRRHAGGKNCKRLEQELMSLISETGVQADIEHVRDLKEISRYGVMGFPALVINRKVKAVGSVPSRSKIKELIREAETEIQHNKA
ncbi:MAG: thioredoxin family protein [Desulfobacteraceae bacterium]|nr:thioredoxin family protein [Desulfobacteraceae bacterium]